MKKASFRLGAVLFFLLDLFLLLVLLVMLFPKEKAMQYAYTAKAGVPGMLEVQLPDGDINVNTADQSTLMKLPGVGEVTAMEIIKEREAHGPFRYPQDLLAVRGIGEKKLAEMLPHIRLDEQP